MVYKRNFAFSHVWQTSINKEKYYDFLKPPSMKPLIQELAKTVALDSSDLSEAKRIHRKLITNANTSSSDRETAEILMATLYRRMIFGNRTGSQPDQNNFLITTRNKMVGVSQKIHQSEAKMVETSEGLSKMVYSFGDYNNMLIHASDFMVKVVHKTNDERIILKYAVRFFMGTVVYLIIKRLLQRFLILKMCSSIISLMYTSIVSGLAKGNGSGNSEL